jgi:Ca2+-binding EF-hand superfamily protein
MLSSVGSTSSEYSASSAAQAQSSFVDKFFKTVDTNSDGKITKSELAKAMESDRVEISSGGQKASADTIFKMLDSGDKGYLTKQDAATGLGQAQGQTESSTSSGKSGGPPKGGGHGGGGGDDSASSTTASLDPADTNQDGKVSSAEAVAYILKQYQQAQAAQNSQSAMYA